MKNINVFVYNDSKLVYDKKWNMDYSVEGIYEFMGGNKLVLEATDTLTANSDTNASLDVALTILEMT